MNSLSQMREGQGEGDAKTFSLTKRFIRFLVNSCQYKAAREQKYKHLVIFRAPEKIFFWLDKTREAGVEGQYASKRGGCNKARASRAGPENLHCSPTEVFMEEITPPGHSHPLRWMMPSPSGGFRDYHSAV